VIGIEFGIKRDGTVAANADGNAVGVADKIAPVPVAAETCC
jgi:hypothetical protein